MVKVSSLELIKNEYQQIIDILIKYQNIEGISLISQSKIAAEFKMCQAQASRMMKKLREIDNCVEEVGPAKYRVIKKDLREDGPINKYIKLIKHLSKHPEIQFLPLLEQAAILNMPISTLKATYSLMSGVYSRSKSRFEKRNKYRVWHWHLGNPSKLYKIVYASTKGRAKEAFMKDNPDCKITSVIWER